MNCTTIGADQLRCYCEADLHLCFGYAKCCLSHDVPHNKEEICIGFQNVIKRITIATLRISVKQERDSKSAGAFKSDKIKQI